MTELKRPDRKLAADILKEVAFEDRLVGITISPMAGTRTTALYSFREAADFLGTDHPGDLLYSRHAALGFLDLKRLTDWIRNVVGDTELSDVIQSELPQCKSRLEELTIAGELMKKRLMQCEVLMRSDSTC